MKTAFLVLLSSLVLLLFLEKKKGDAKGKFITHHAPLDSLKIHHYLNEPIDYDKLDDSKIKVVKTDSISNIVPGRYIEYKYFASGNRIATMRGFQHKIDATWQLGHSGWFMNLFTCESQELPLRFNLKVDSDINDFIEFFGIPKKQNSKYLYYDFSHWPAMKKMKIYMEESNVTKIEIIATNKS